MRLSLYTPFGLLKFSGASSVFERMHRSIKALFGPDISTEDGSFADIFAYVLANGLARAHEFIERADRQGTARAYDLLAQQEDERGIVPPPTATVWDRQKALAARRRSPHGNTRAALETMLSSMLGLDYVGLVLTQTSDAQLSPVALGTQPHNLVPEFVDRSIVALVTPVSIRLGTTPQTVRYSYIDPFGTNFSVQVGDTVVIEPEVQGITETVTVTDAGVGVFTAAFTKPHSPGAIITKMPWTAWESTKRHYVVVVTGRVANDPARRQTINEQLDRTLPAQSTWAVVQQTAHGAVSINGDGVPTWTSNGLVYGIHAGPFVVGDPTNGVVGQNAMGESVG